MDRAKARACDAATSHKPQHTELGCSIRDSSRMLAGCFLRMQLHPPRACATVLAPQSISSPVTLLQRNGEKRGRCPHALHPQKPLSTSIATNIVQKKRRPKQHRNRTPQLTLRSVAVRIQSAGFPPPPLHEFSSRRASLPVPQFPSSSWREVLSWYSSQAPSARQTTAPGNPLGVPPENALFINRIGSTALFFGGRASQSHKQKPFDAASKCGEGALTVAC